MAAPLIQRDKQLDRIRWIDNVPFWGVHAAAAVGLYLVGFSWLGIALCAGSYFLRMFGITAGYHRYFSHRTYKTSRAGQVFLALLGVFSTQKGPLWWAAHHRNHHKYSDEPEDIHSPRQRGFWWSHMFWILVERHKKADFSKIKDLTKYPELVFIDRFEILFTVAYATGLYFAFGPIGLVYGYFLSTVILWHGTFTINSLAHVWGKRRYQTTDDSRNNVVLALLTGGEGWHNNHHHYQRSCSQGFYWWEIDTTYYGIKLMQALRIVWDVQGVPRHVRDNTEAPGRARLDGDDNEQLAA
jgi:stearoyl-CoA desaturase (delta-9 desaturase)